MFARINIEWRQLLYFHLLYTMHVTNLKVLRDKHLTIFMLFFLCHSMLYVNSTHPWQILEANAILINRFF